MPLNSVLYLYLTIAFSQLVSARIDSLHQIRLIAIQGQTDMDVLVNSITARSYDGLMISAACSMAFAAFLRAGELTILSNQRVNDSECVHIDDIEFMGNHSYVLILRSSKTDIFRHGVRIPVYSYHKSFCPVQIMTEYIKLRRCAGAIDSDPLFVTAKGFILSRCVLFQTSEPFSAPWDTILRNSMNTA